MKDPCGFLPQKATFQPGTIFFLKATDTTLSRDLYIHIFLITSIMSVLFHFYDKWIFSLTRHLSLILIRKL